MPGFVLEAIDLLYIKSDKFEEALKIYATALQKLSDMSTRIKARLYLEMSSCYNHLQIHSKSLESVQLAYSMNNTLFGTRHRKTLQSLD